MKNKPIIIKEQGKIFKEQKYQKISKLLNFFDKERIRINQFFAMNKMVEYLNQNNPFASPLLYFFTQTNQNFCRENNCSTFSTRIYST